MPTHDPLAEAIRSSADLSPRIVSAMLRRPLLEVEMKLCGELPFNVAEVVVLSTHLGIDWRPLLSNGAERPVD